MCFRESSVAVLAFVLTGLMFFIPIYLLGRRARTEYQAAASRLAEINRIPLQEAKLQAESLLMNPELFVCISAQRPSPAPTALPAGIREFFSRYESVEAADGAFIVDRKLVGPSKVQSGFIAFAQGMVGTEMEFELGVGETGDTVYELSGGEPVDADHGTYASIYHWLIAESAELALAEGRKEGTRFSQVLRRSLRSAVAVLVAVLLWRFSGTLLWVPALLLAAFFLAVDVFSFGKNVVGELDINAERGDHPFGVLGKYKIDGEDIYGLFLKLLDRAVFVSIKEDDLLLDRTEQAIGLVRHRAVLEASLRRFVGANPEYATRRLTFIQLCSRVKGQGEVFWEPDGYTLLNNFEFEA